MPDVWDAISTPVGTPKPKPAASGWNAVGSPVSYPSNDAFRASMDKTFGAGKWKDTGDYRTPAREAQLRAQGAATAKGMSDHSRGSPDAPGAHDIVVPGMSPTAVTAALKKAGYDPLAEGAAGGQGPHIHVGTRMAPSTSWDDVGKVISSSGSAAPKSQAPVETPTSPSVWDPFSTIVGEVKGAVHTVAEDVRQDIAARGRAKNFVSGFTHPTEPGGVLRAGKELADAWNAISSPVTGAYRAAVAKPIAELESRIPLPKGVTPETKQEIEDRTMESMLGLAATRGPIPRTPSIPRPPTDPALAGKVVRGEADPIERIDNALFRLGNHNTAGKVEALQHVRDLPKEVRDPKVQEELTHAVEQKMVDPNAQIPEHLKAAEAARAPWAERQRMAINEVRQKLKAKGLSDQEIEDYLPDSGYVPRRVQGKSPGIDESGPQRRGPLDWRGPRAGLSKSTGSLRQRNQIVLEFEDGTRRFEHRNPSNDQWQAGMTVRDPLTGKTAVVKPATIKEIEGAGAVDREGNKITYHKNALVNTIDEALKAERVNRNIDVLDELTNQMKDRGLAHRAEWRFQDEDGQWIVHKANEPTPEGFVEVPGIPQLKGWLFDPKVAEVLKDYFPTHDSNLDGWLSKINRALNASLFITPFPHIKNVGTMGFVGRGWDWIPGSGNYGRLARTGRQAIKEVLTMGPKYREFLREGSGMQAADDATRNFYQTLMQSAAKGIAGDPAIGKATSLNPVELGKALYAASHKFLWNVNDMILLQRQLELVEKGMSKLDAIKESERWIANYRIPSQVMRSRALAELFKDGKWINFGRYTYGKWRAIGEMIKGIGSDDPAEQKNALGKVVMAGVAGLILYPLMDKMLQGATGNPKARVPRGGELAPIDAALDREKDWAAKVSSVLTPAPLIEHGEEVANNRNLYTGQHLVEPGSTPLGQGVQAGEYGAGLFYPLGLGMEAMQPGGDIQALGRLGAVSIPPERSQRGKIKGKAFDRSRARSREKKDEIEQWLRENAQ